MPAWVSVHAGHRTVLFEPDSFRPFDAPLTLSVKGLGGSRFCVSGVVIPDDHAGLFLSIRGPAQLPLIVDVAVRGLTDSHVWSRIPGFATLVNFVICSRENAPVLGP